MSTRNCNFRTKDSKMFSIKNMGMCRLDSFLIHIHSFPQYSFPYRTLSWLAKLYLGRKILEGHLPLPPSYPYGYRWYLSLWCFPENFMEFYFHKTKFVWQRLSVGVVCICLWCLYNVSFIHVFIKCLLFFLLFFRFGCLRLAILLHFITSVITLNRL